MQFSVIAAIFIRKKHFQNLMPGFVRFGEITSANLRNVLIQITLDEYCFAIEIAITLLISVIKYFVC
ncbi:hypothetical protein [Ruminococcus sp.]|uniref:hypothetical protein n=1 Tax=Ruminococcus sp. TaxID=41978 RepID=UPI003FD7B8E3